MQYMDKAGRVVLLNIMFLFSCLPIVTFGMAVEGMYFAIFQWVIRKDDRVFHNYVEGIRRRWKVSLAGWLLCLAAAAFFLIEFQAIGEMLFPWNYVCGCVAALTAFCIAVTALYYFAVAAFTDVTIRNLVVISFAGGMKCLLYTLLLLVLWIAEIFLCSISVWLVPLWVTCGFALFAWARSFIFLRVFQKIELYRKEEE
ncbi:MAG: DUF624 domain-containing protein [Lachnospiraceae bacterium]|nr:DUF624 domain-containing protein [Lachnospiraceae bacterium]